MKGLKEQRAEAQKETYEWYDMLLAHCAVSLLTSVATIGYKMGIDYYKVLRNKGIFPLNPIRASKKNVRKIKLVNCCPRIFLALIRVKNG